VKILLLGTYELGRQPFGLASPAAWLRKRGHAVRCCDLSRQGLNETALQEAQLIVFYLPMHTATRLALQWVKAIRATNPVARLCACGLYAPLNKTLLREAGFAFVLGPEFEGELCEVAEALASGGNFAATGNGDAKLPRLSFETPDRSDLPALREYAHVVMADGEHRTAGYTEASRGCKHLCRHCPIVPVYAGQFRVVPVEVVLADVRQQVAAGAEHITFGDPDFFNGVTHAMRIVEAMHAEFPHLTYDATIKVEHLLRHADQLAKLARTGCLFVTSAVESVDDEILRKLDKRHTRADFFRALDLCEDADLALQPTFVPFTPWTTREGYLDLLEVIADRELIGSVASVQLAIRLLIPSRSRLLELAEIAALVGEFDAEKLVYPWRHPDPTLDALAESVSTVVAAGEKEKLSRATMFEQIWEAAAELSGKSARPRNLTDTRRGVPFLSEPWYC
jgi:radical SAM superfamily enzyme YgiQ (UPF0313 family)